MAIEKPYDHPIAMSTALDLPAPAVAKETALEVGDKSVDGVVIYEDETVKRTASWQVRHSTAHTDSLFAGPLIFAWRD